MKIAVRLLDAVHFRCLNARGTRLTVQKALPLFNVFVDHESLRGPLGFFQKVRRARSGEVQGGA